MITLPPTPLLIFGTFLIAGCLALQARDNKPLPKFKSTYKSVQTIGDCAYCHEKKATHIIGDANIEDKCLKICKWCFNNPTVANRRERGLCYEDINENEVMD